MRYNHHIDITEIKTMATKKKVTIEVTTGVDAQVSQPISLSYDSEAQQILDHFGENSTEYAEAKAKAEVE